jgi:hypothetical protein
VRVEIVHVGGRYFERVFEHLSALSPGNVIAYQVPRGLPPVLDEAAEFLPSELGSGHVVIAIDIHPELLLEIPRQVQGGSVAALIAPIEDPNWIKPGLQRQATQVCARHEIESAFPKPFCALQPVTPAIAEFCEEYRVGVPTFRLRVSGGKVVEAEAVSGSACGLTDAVAQQLVGLPADDSLPEKAGQFHHAYPCLASMNLDPATDETIMHASLYLIRDRVAEALREAQASG